MSLDPIELKETVDLIRKTEISLGNSSKNVLKEKENSCL